jgi:hypothetical protein
MPADPEDIVIGGKKTIRTRWYKFKAKHALTQYDVFKKESKNKSGGSYGNVHLSRLKVIGQNVFTLGLINIKYRIDQDRSRLKSGKGKTSNFAVNHNAMAESLIERLQGICLTCNIGYPGFARDLSYSLREDLGLGGNAQTSRSIDPKYEQQFFELLTDIRTQPTFEKLLRVLGA